MPYSDKDKQREAQARYYQENKSKITASQRSKRSLMRRLVQERKGSTPCRDCGINYPYYVMDFDHLPRNEKSFNIGGQISKAGNLEALMREIDKCEIVCANCHRHRTFMRKTKG